jgi:hypothetical protein
MAKNPLATQDVVRILRCLRRGPVTSKEIADAIPMDQLRVIKLLLAMEKKQIAHAPHRTLDNVNLWELMAPTIKKAKFQDATPGARLWIKAHGQLEPVTVIETHATGKAHYQVTWVDAKGRTKKDTLNALYSKPEG